MARPRAVDGGDLDKVVFHIRPVTPRIHPHRAPDTAGNGAQEGQIAPRIRRLAGDMRVKGGSAGGDVLGQSRSR